MVIRVACTVSRFRIRHCRVVLCLSSGPIGRICICIWSIKSLVGIWVSSRIF